MLCAKYVCLGVLPVLLLSVVCGCADSIVAGNPRLISIKREVNTDGHTVVVIPFKDAGHGYFESADGSELTDRTVHQMRIHLPKTRFVSALPIRRKFDQTQLGDVSVEELGKTVRADMVLVGNLKEFSTQEPKTRLILRGTCEIDLMLFDVGTKSEVWKRSLTIHYPERGSGGSQGPPFSCSCHLLNPRAWRRFATQTPAI